jgi:hypothetical protein
MRSICWNVGRFPSSHYAFLSSKNGLQFTIEENESFLKVVAMGRRTSARWHVHVNQAMQAGGVLLGKQHGVRVANQAKVGRVKTQKATQKAPA